MNQRKFWSVNNLGNDSWWGERGEGEGKGGGKNNTVRKSSKNESREKIS